MCKDTPRRKKNSLDSMIWAAEEKRAHMEQGKQPSRSNEKENVPEHDRNMPGKGLAGPVQVAEEKRARRYTEKEFNELLSQIENALSDSDYIQVPLDNYPGFTLGVQRLYPIDNDNEPVCHLHLKLTSADLEFMWQRGVILDKENNILAVPLKKGLKEILNRFERLRSAIEKDVNTPETTLEALGKGKYYSVIQAAEIKRLLIKAIQDNDFSAKPFREKPLER